ncbi:MAG: tetratricopeptide repeat protein [Terriglobales bacterium]|jgi:tetratricopeptide (TPR) repeat protein|nr:tetratricopeptide repeat protein [Terriglobales bacterium]
MQSLAQIPDQLQQMNSTQTFDVTMYKNAPNRAVISVHVFAEEKPNDLDRPARLDLANLANHLGVFMVTPAHGGAVFTNVVLGKYDLTVTAVGYLSSHQDVTVLSPVTQQVDIVLHRDPYAVSLNEASGSMPTKAKKEARRVVSLLRSGQLDDARKHLEKAYNLSPSNADLNFLLGYLHFQQQDYEQAGRYLSTAASLNPHSAQTLTLLGRTNLLRENYPAARSALEQAILADSEDWQAHDLLAVAYLHEKEYSMARDEAQTAIAKGVRNASASAELALGQALIGLGKREEAVQALKIFVNESREHSVVSEVRTMITNLQKTEVGSAAGGNSIGADITTQVDLIAAVPKPVLSIQTWRPPDIDDAKPVLTPGETCPATQVLAGSGERVRELVQDVTRFGADEVLFHRSLDSVGLSAYTETRKYSYVAAISTRPGSVVIDEYRTDRNVQAGDPDSISTTGFVMLPLVFHPEIQGDFEFDCEGQGDWNGQTVWLMHFRQRPDRPNRMQDYTVAGKSFRIDLKGRAWISADKFQIMRIDADIVTPIHEIQLLSEHQRVEFGPVPFAKKNTSLWLPKDAEIYLDFGKHHYYRRHSFDHYMLFDVDVAEKDKVPPGAPTSGPTATAEKNP